MAPRRSRITAELMEMLQILKFSIKRDRVLSFTQGMSLDDEWDELEFNAELHVRNPDDFNSFVRSINH